MVVLLVDERDASRGMPQRSSAGDTTESCSDDDDTRQALEAKGRLAR